MNSLVITSVISILKDTETMSALPSTSIALSKVCSSSSRKASGVEMSIFLPRKEESAVAEEPIIWFMTSQAALMLSSSNSMGASGSTSMPIRRPRITCISLWRNTMTFAPEMPSIYLILTIIAGSSDR